MPIPRMSPQALERCRSMIMTLQPDGRTHFAVTDPRLPSKKVCEHFTRTPHDKARIKRALQTQYRIPEQNITEIDGTADGAN